MLHSFISTVRLAAQINPSRKRSFLKRSCLQNGGYENATFAFSCWVEKSLKADDGVMFDRNGDCCVKFLTQNKSSRIRLYWNFPKENK